MAPNSTITAPATKLCFLFLVAIFAITSTSNSQVRAQAHDYYGQLKETKMTVHFQDFFGGPNSTATILTGIPGKAWSLFGFGTVLVTDDLITEGPHMRSPEVGRGQGIYVTSSLDGANTQVMISIVFTNREYNGSTLEIQGRSVQLASVTETSVVGGTGKFRFAKGFATFETIFVDSSIFYSVIRCNVTVLHY